MSNEEICLIVYKKINIVGICRVLGVKNDIDEMTSIVYESILRANNDTLNDVVKNKALLSYVYRIVSNKITSGEWFNIQKYKRNSIEINNIDRIDEYIDEEREEKLLFLDEELKSIDNSDILKMNWTEQDYFTRKYILKNKILKEWTLDDVRDKFKMGRNKANNIIKGTKEQLRNKYENRNIT